jgi:CopG family transcriptional regulator/antitoxin EndoAI
VPGLSETKRIIVFLPESIVEEVDDIVLNEKKDRSDFIKEAVYTVLLERRKAGIREQMRQGYVEMAQINLSLAKDLCHAEEELKKGLRIIQLVRFANPGIPCVVQ